MFETGPPVCRLPQAPTLYRSVSAAARLGECFPWTSYLIKPALPSVAKREAKAVKFGSMDLETILNYSPTNPVFKMREARAVGGVPGATEGENVYRTAWHYADGT